MLAAMNFLRNADARKTIYVFINDEVNTSDFSIIRDIERIVHHFHQEVIFVMEQFSMHVIIISLGSTHIGLHGVVSL